MSYSTPCSYLHLLNHWSQLPGVGLFVIHNASRHIVKDVKSETLQQNIHICSSDDFISVVLFLSVFCMSLSSGWFWMQCTDLGFHLSVSRVVRGYLSNKNRLLQNTKNGLQQLDTAVTALNQGQDRDALLQAHNTAFCLPFRFQYQPHEGDQVTNQTRIIAVQ